MVITQARKLVWLVLAAAVGGCAGTPREPCCDWAGIDARTLLGHDGVDCGIIDSHPLEPRTQQLRCVRNAAKRRLPYMVTYRDSSHPGGTVTDTAIFSAQGENILLQQHASGVEPVNYVGTCAHMSIAPDGRIQRDKCTERAAPTG